MATRIIYFLFGAILVAVFVANHSPTQAFISTASYKVASQVGLKHLQSTSEIEGGYDMPRKVFIDERLLDVPLNWSWNYVPKREGKHMSTWLYYGSVPDQIQLFVVGFQFPGTRPFRYGGIRSEVSGLKVLSKKGMFKRFTGDLTVMATSYGNLDTESFILNHQGVTKSCIGYLSKPEMKSRKLEGFYCEKPGVVARRAKLKCLINSLKVTRLPRLQEPPRKGRAPSCTSEAMASADESAI